MIILLYLWTLGLGFSVGGVDHNSPKLSSMLDLICIEDVYSDIFRNPAFCTKINNFTVLLDASGYYIPTNEPGIYLGTPREEELTKWEWEYRGNAVLRSAFLIPVKKIIIGVEDEEIYAVSSDRELFLDGRGAAYGDAKGRILTFFTAIPVGAFSIGYKFSPIGKVTCKEIWTHEWMEDDGCHSWTTTDTSYISFPLEHNIGIMYDKNICCDVMWHFSYFDPGYYSNGTMRIKKQIKPSLIIGTDINVGWYKYLFSDTSYTYFYHSYSLGASFLPGKYLTYGIDIRFSSFSDYPDVVIGVEKKIRKLALRGGMEIGTNSPELNKLSIGMGYESKNFSIDAVIPADDEGLRIGIRRTF
jgi:hypothetical protein